MPKVCVIIPAAGAGKRFRLRQGFAGQVGGKVNKIFLPIAGRAMFIRTLELFAARDDVCQIVMAAAAEDIDQINRGFAADLEAMAVEVVRGGPVRSQSVRNALARLSDDAELVCVHDAVRPCVAQAWTDAVFAEAAAWGAAILACPVHGTLKKVAADNVIRQTVERGGLWEAQTPQVFRRDIIQAAYAAQDAATDDAHLVQAAGYTVKVVPGDPRNIKITTPQDLAAAEAALGSLAQ